MAHNIQIRNGKASMVYSGETPWHTLGTKLPSNATWEQVRDLGGFYSVRKENVLTASGAVIPNAKAIVRTDTGEALSIVSDAYCVIQFEEVAKTLVEAARGVGAIFNTAGLLGANGARGWMLAELPKVIRVKGDESEIRPFLLGCAAHDGHHGVVLRNVATRVVCQNTLGVAMGEDTKYHVAIHHTTNATARFEAATKAFHMLLDGMSEFEEMANMLANAKFTERQMQRTIDTLLPLKMVDGVEQEAGKQLADKRERVLSLFETGVGIGAGIRGTAWAAFQAWTEYSDHHRVLRGDDNGAKRLESIWLGRAADMKTDALAAITAAIAS